MEGWHAVMVVGRTMKIAIGLSLMIGGFFFVQNMKNGSLSTLTGKIGMLAGADNGLGMLTGVGGEEDLLSAIKSPGAKKISWSESPLPHPGETPALTLRYRCSPRSLADSEYQVRFGDGANAPCCWLPFDGEVHAVMDAYWYPSAGRFGPCIRVQDYMNEYLIDLDEQKTYLIIRYADQVYAGEISESAPGHLTSASRDPGGEAEIHVYVGGNEADDITQTAIASTPGVYFGGIELRPTSLKFIPASAE